MVGTHVRKRPLSRAWGIHGEFSFNCSLSDESAWNTIVLKGALEPFDMIGFAKWLKADDVDAIRAFVAKQARPLRQDQDSNRPANAREIPVQRTAER